MREITDEILNKYLDNELDKETQIYVSKELKSSVELQRRYNALKLIHENLSSITEENLSGDFTAAVMKRLPGKVKAGKKDKAFIFSISSFFIIVSLVIIGIVTAGIIGASQESAADSKILENALAFMSDIVQAFISLFSSQNISIFGSIISLGVIITGYFFFEFYKRTDAKNI